MVYHLTNAQTNVPAESFVKLFFSICMSREFVKLSGSLLAANFYFPQRPNREKKKGRRFAFDVRINQTRKRQKVFFAAMDRQLTLDF